MDRTVGRETAAYSKSATLAGRIGTALFALVLAFAALLAPATAFADPESVSYADETFVYDQYGAISESLASTLNEQARTLAGQSGIGAYLVMLDNLGNDTASTYAQQFYEVNELGIGSNDSGILLVVAIGDREYDIVTFGDAGETFGSTTVDSLDSEVLPYLNRSDWAGAAETFYEDVERTLTGSNSTSGASAVEYTAGTFVIDDYGLFTTEQYDALEAKAEQLADTYDMGVYLLAVGNIGSSNPSSAQRTNYATTFYRENGLGLGTGKDGILFMIAVESRDYVTIAYGQGSYSFSDDGIEVIEDAVVSQLRNDDWYGGAEVYYDGVEDQLSYYSRHDDPWEPLDPFDIAVRVILILGVPALVAYFIVRRERDAMKTAVAASEASRYLDPESFALSVSTDQFVNTTLVATPRPKHEDSDGGFGGGGGWGGGGGGGFSSSGGGKF